MYSYIFPIDFLSIWSRFSRTVAKKIRKSSGSEIRILPASLRIFVKLLFQYRHSLTYLVKKKKTGYYYPVFFQPIAPVAWPGSIQDVRRGHFFAAIPSLIAFTTPSLEVSLIVRSMPLFS